MNVLFIGDIFGRAGRRTVRDLLPGVRKEYAIDLVIANVDNARHGRGLDLEAYAELVGLDIDWMMGGNHIWDVREFYPFLDDPKVRVLRPDNYPPSAPGRGIVTFDHAGEKVTLIHLQGQVFMNPPQVGNPFLHIDKILERSEGTVFVDFHAEATSEKTTLGQYLDGRVAAVIGTHTHIQTADERVLPGGTAYITDVGMTGPRDGSIGVSLESILPAYLKGLPVKMDPAHGPTKFNAVVIECKEAKATRIERINLTVQ